MFRLQVKKGRSVRIFEKKTILFDEKNNEHVYKYICTHDPDGNPELIKPHYRRIEDKNTEYIQDKIYQVLAREWKSRRFFYYVGHYDSQKYYKNKERFEKGELKSRPNGRAKLCKIGEHLVWDGHKTSKELYEVNTWV